MLTNSLIINLIYYIILNLIFFYFFVSDGRLLSEPFMKLPPRKDYPDYYDIIKKPIDITKIFARIEDAKVNNFL